MPSTPTRRADGARVISYGRDIRHIKLDKLCECICKFYILSTAIPNLLSQVSLEMATIYTVRESELTVPQVLAIVSNVDTEKLSTRVPQKPLGGQVFVYNSLENSVTKDDWLADGYRWINNGTARLPIKEATVLKRKFKAWTPDGGTTGIYFFDCFFYKT